MDKQTAELIARIAENLPDMSGDLMQRWIEDPKTLQETLRDALCPREKIDVWRTIELGTGPETAEDLLRVLKAGKFQVSNSASDMIRNPAFTIAPKKTKLELVKVSVAELGFNRVQFDQIYERAKEKFGLGPCPAEAGPQLREQYPKQPNGECLFIAMNPIIASGGVPRVFYVERSVSGLWLLSYWSAPDGFWAAVDQWVFCRK